LNGGDPSQLNRRKRRKTEPITFSDQRVVIDLSWDEYMSDKDIRKLASQLGYAYGANFKVARPFQLHFTSFSGRLAKYLETRSDWKHWRVHIHAESYLHVFRKEELVYLTSDSPNEIQTLDPQKVYIIGGLVDHNRLKGITFQKAQTEGIATARLPIDHFFVMKTRKVLTVNQVLEILLAYASGSHNWEEALLNVIPKRKGAQLKQQIFSHNNKCDSTNDNK
jgi:tRNA (guanine9-N1)-methyltransferase